MAWSSNVSTFSDACFSLFAVNVRWTNRVFLCEIQHFLQISKFLFCQLWKEHFDTTKTDQIASQFSQTIKLKSPKYKIKCSVLMSKANNVSAVLWWELWRRLEVIIRTSRQKWISWRFKGGGVIPQITQDQTSVHSEPKISKAQVDTRHPYRTPVQQRPAHRFQ